MFLKALRQIFATKLVDLVRKPFPTGQRMSVDIGVFCIRHLLRDLLRLTVQFLFQGLQASLVELGIADLVIGPALEQILRDIGIAGNLLVISIGPVD